jgi:DNA-binding response OmpR family regulator
MTTIAVVEDNDDLREFTALFLVQHGYQVLPCADAESFLETNAIIDLFLVDINLPEMDGFTLVRSIRESDPNAAIIVLSARDWDADIAMGYDVGADIYLTKPTDPNVLLSAVRRLTQRSSGQTSRSGYLEVDRAQQVMCFKASSCSITSSELAILNRLAIAGIRGLERFEMAEVLELDLDIGSRKAMDVRIVRLRKKLASIGCARSALETMRGFGYRLNLRVQFSG